MVEPSGFLNFTFILERGGEGERYNIHDENHRLPASCRPPTGGRAHSLAGTLVGNRTSPSCAGADAQPRSHTGWTWTCTLDSFSFISALIVTISFLLRTGALIAVRVLVSLSVKFGRLCKFSCFSREACDATHSLLGGGGACVPQTVSWGALGGMRSTRRRRPVLGSDI